MDGRVTTGSRLLKIPKSRLKQAYLVTTCGMADAHDAARQFIRRIYCETGEGCGRCVACRSFEEGNLVGYLEIGGGDQASIKLEEVRSIPQFLRPKAERGQLRCIYIKGAHRMNAQAQNYLLKSLEEPAEDVIFVLSSDHPERLLKTVLSRCEQVIIRPLPAEQVRRELERMGISDEAGFAAAWSGGSVCQAVELAKDEELRTIRMQAADVCEWITDRKNPSVFEIEQTILTHENRLADFFTAMMLLFRDGLFYSVCNESFALLNPDYQELALKIGQGFTSLQLYNIINIIRKRLERKQNSPGLRNKLLIEGMLFDILEVKAWQK